MKRRLLLSAVVLALLAGAVALLLGGDEPTAAPSDSPAATNRVAPPARIAAEHRPGRTRPAGGPAAGRLAVREDGTAAVDHRSQAAPWIRPALPHRDASPVDGVVTTAAMRLVRPVVQRCLATVPATALGADPMVLTRVELAIDDAGTLSVFELGPALKDIDEAAAGAALDCIRAGAAGLTATVDHPPVEAATLALHVHPRDVVPAAGSAPR